MFRNVLICVTTIVVTTACSQDSRAQQPRLGTIDFPVSASSAVAVHFTRGVLFLHSFEYGLAAEEFRKAQKLDPAFAMAYWGEAMTQTHPVWNEQNQAGARQILGRLASTSQSRRAKALTQREKAYLNAVETLYGEGGKARRDTLYSGEMKRLMTAYPDDLEARAFYALSLLGLNQGNRDVATYLEAAEIAKPVFAWNPDHPGAAHYIIHSYDDPEHASLGLAAAQAYSKIAPGAAHAQHMTTHIFLALGMWDEVVSQNEIASGPDRDTWTPGHYTWWLNYGLLQQGRKAEALRMLNQMTPRSGKALPPRQDYALRQMRARYAVDTEDWDAAGDLGNTTEAMFVKGFAAFKRQQRAELAGALSSIESLNGKAGTSVDSYNAIQELELRGLSRFANGDRAAAMALMDTAVAREIALPVDFGPPGLLKPTRELYGELLLEAGDAQAARHQLGLALKMTPRRARTLAGLAAAEKASGDSAAAAATLATLAAITRSQSTAGTGRK
ncbi:MAG: hypothetical protein ABIS03_14585 [Gemmatimonadaceae bacterium]